MRLAMTVVDPCTGLYPPAGSDTFWIVFVDGVYAQLQGSPSTTYTKRQACPRVVAKSLSGYVSQGAVIGVWYQDARWWTDQGDGSSIAGQETTTTTAPPSCAGVANSFGVPRAAIGSRRPKPAGPRPPRPRRRSLVRALHLDDYLDHDRRSLDQHNHVDDDAGPLFDVRLSDLLRLDRRRMHVYRLPGGHAAGDRFLHLVDDHHVDDAGSQLRLRHDDDHGGAGDRAMGFYPGRGLGRVERRLSARTGGAAAGRGRRAWCQIVSTNCGGGGGGGGGGTSCTGDCLYSWVGVIGQYVFEDQKGGCQGAGVACGCAPRTRAIRGAVIRSPSAARARPRRPPRPLPAPAVIRPPRPPRPRPALPRPVRARPTAASGRGPTVATGRTSKTCAPRRAAAIRRPTRPTRPARRPEPVRASADHHDNDHHAGPDYDHQHTTTLRPCSDPSAGTVQTTTGGETLWQWNGSTWVFQASNADCSGYGVPPTAPGTSCQCVLTLCVTTTTTTTTSTTPARPRQQLPARRPSPQRRPPPPRPCRRGGVLRSPTMTALMAAIACRARRRRSRRIRRRRQLDLRRPVHQRGSVPVRLHVDDHHHHDLGARLVLRPQRSGRDAVLGRRRLRIRGLAAGRHHALQRALFDVRCLPGRQPGRRLPNHHDHDSRSVRIEKP